MQINKIKIRMKTLMFKVLALPIGIVFRFVPRDNNLWITGNVINQIYGDGLPDFFDNSKYFYLYLLHHTNEKVVWISSSKKETELLNSMNLPVVPFKSIKGLYLTLRAKYSFHHYGPDRICKELQYGSIQINFWHGTGIKKVCYDVNKNPLDNKVRRFVHTVLNHGGDLYASCTSHFLSERYFAHAYGVPLDHMINFCYPRMDVMKLSREDTISFCKKYSQNLIKYINIAQSFQNVLLYMPTWRDYDKRYIEKASIDFKRLNDCLIEENAVMFIKLHPLTPDIEIDNYSNIMQIENGVDIYPFLTFTSCLVTDYSSICYDYIVLDKEMVFIPYDWDEYTVKRELYFSAQEYKDYMPGKIYNSFDIFTNNLHNILHEDTSSLRKSVRELFYDSYNFDACEKTYQFIKQKYK